jgi:hypothetical protein
MLFTIKKQQQNLVALTFESPEFDGVGEISKLWMELCALVQGIQRLHRGVSLFIYLRHTVYRKWYRKYRYYKFSTVVMYRYR